MSAQWAVHTDENGHEYYFNEATGESAWQIPEDSTANTGGEVHEDAQAQVLDAVTIGDEGNFTETDPGSSIEVLKAENAAAQQTPASDVVNEAGGGTHSDFVSTGIGNTGVMEAHTIGEQAINAEATDDDLKKAGWEEHDDGAGNLYFWNTKTGESRWTRPVLFVKTLRAFSSMVSDSGAADGLNAEGADSNESAVVQQTENEQEPMPEGWEEHHDAEGFVFYWNRNTGESLWTRPVVVVKEKEVEPEATVDSIMQEFGSEAANREHKENTKPLPCPAGFDPVEWAELDRELQLDLADVPVDSDDQPGANDDFGFSSGEDEEVEKSQKEKEEKEMQDNVAELPVKIDVSAQKTKREIQNDVAAMRTKDIRRHLEAKDLSTKGLRKDMSTRLVNALLGDQQVKQHRQELALQQQKQIRIGKKTSTTGRPKRKSSSGHNNGEIKRMTSMPEEMKVAIGGPTRGRRRGRRGPPIPGPETDGFDTVEADERRRAKQAAEARYLKAKRDALVARELERANKAQMHKDMKRLCGIKDQIPLRIKPSHVGKKGKYERVLHIEEYQDEATGQYFYYMPEKITGWRLRNTPIPEHTCIKIRQNRRYVPEWEEDDEDDEQREDSGGHVECDIICPICWGWVQTERMEAFVEEEENYRKEYERSRQHVKQKGRPDRRMQLVPSQKRPTFADASLPPVGPAPGVVPNTMAVPPQKAPAVSAKRQVGGRSAGGPKPPTRRVGKPMRPRKEVRAGLYDGRRRVEEEERNRRAVVEAQLRKQESKIEEYRQLERRSWGRLLTVAVREEEVDDIMDPVELHEVGWKHYILPRKEVFAKTERLQNLWKSVVPNLCASLGSRTDFRSFYYNRALLRGRWEHPFMRVDDRTRMMPLSFHERKRCDEAWAAESKRRKEWVMRHDDMVGGERRRREMWQEERQQRAYVLQQQLALQEVEMKRQKCARERFRKMKAGCIKLRQTAIARLQWMYFCGETLNGSHHLVYDAAAGKQFELKETRLPERNADFTHSAFLSLRHDMRMVGKADPHLVKLSQVFACPIPGDRDLRLRNVVVVTEHLTKGTLADRMRQRVPTPQALAWIRYVALALSCLHRCKLNHGNLTGEAVGFNADGVLKVGNFNLDDKDPFCVSRAPADIMALGRLLLRLVKGDRGRENSSVNKFTPISAVLKTIPWSAGRTVTELIRRTFEPDESLRWKAADVVECIEAGIVVRISNLQIDINVSAQTQRNNAASTYDSKVEEKVAKEGENLGLKNFLQFIKTKQGGKAMRIESAKSAFLRNKLKTMNRTDGTMPMQDELLQVAKRHFERVDTDHSGELNISEFSELLCDLGFRTLEEKDMLLIFRALDVDFSGMISLTEFSSWFIAGRQADQMLKGQQKALVRKFRDANQARLEGRKEMQDILKRMDMQAAIARVSISWGKRARLDAINKYRKSNPPPQPPLWEKVETLRQMNRMGTAHPSNYSKEVVEAAFSFFSETAGADGSDGVYNELDYDWSLV